MPETFQHIDTIQVYLAATEAESAWPMMRKKKLWDHSHII